MTAVSSFAHNYWGGCKMLPIAFSAATLSTYVGQLLGAQTSTTLYDYYWGFQSEFSSGLNNILPSSPLAYRAAAFLALVVSSNQLYPVVEEIAFRWLLQGKILSCLTSRFQNRPGKPKGIDKAKVIKIALSSLLFGYVHYYMKFPQDCPNETACQLLTGMATYEFFLTLGTGAVYGYLYETKGLAASIGAHAAWNMSYDLWFDKTWRYPQPV